MFIVIIYSFQFCLSLFFILSFFLVQWSSRADFSNIVGEREVNEWSSFQSTMGANCRISDLIQGRRYFFRASCGNIKGWGQYRVSIPNSVIPSSKLWNKICPFFCWHRLNIIMRTQILTRKYIWWEISTVITVNNLSMCQSKINVFYLNLFLLFFDIKIFRLAWHRQCWITFCWTSKSSWWIIYSCTIIKTNWCIWNTIWYKWFTTSKSKEKDNDKTTVFGRIKISKKFTAVNNTKKSICIQIYCI